MKAVTHSSDALRTAIAGLPTTRHEDWKYTDLSFIADIGNQWLDQGASVTTAGDLPDAARMIQDKFEADWLVIGNGVIDAESLAAISQPGIAVTRLDHANDEQAIDSPLVSLNAALLRDRLHIRVSANAKQTRPIGLLIIDNSDTAATMSAARIEIELESGSHASIIEFHTSSGAKEHYANSIVSVKLGDESSIDYVRVQDRDRRHCQTGHLAVSLGRDSRFDHCVFDLGGRLIRNDLHIDIANPGATASFNGIYLAGDKQHIDNHTRVDHRVGPADSHQEYRGILSGNARCIWNGKTVVHAGADGTDAEQENHNLLLSEKAEIDAKPELEIYADDVKCSHGTTVGQLDEAALFYMRTRGLNRQKAKEILTRAFAQAIVSKSPIASTREALAEMIFARLTDIVKGATA